MYEEVLALCHPAVEFAWKHHCTALADLHLIIQHPSPLEAEPDFLFPPS